MIMSIMNPEHSFKGGGNVYFTIKGESTGIKLNKENIHIHSFPMKNMRLTNRTRL